MTIHIPEYQVFPWQSEYQTQRQYFEPEPNRSVGQPKVDYDSLVLGWLSHVLLVMVSRLLSIVYGVLLIVWNERWETSSVDMLLTLVLHVLLWTIPLSDATPLKCENASCFPYIRIEIYHLLSIILTPSDIFNCSSGICFSTRSGTFEFQEKQSDKFLLQKDHLPSKLSHLLRIGYSDA